MLLQEGASSSKLSFPSFLQPQSRAKLEPVPVGDPEASSGTWEGLGWGERLLLGADAYEGGQDREEAGQSTALPSLITSLHTLRSRTSQPPNNSFSSPSP